MRQVKTSIVSSGNDFRIVKNNGKVEEDASLVFTFSNFKMSSVTLEDFNNFYKDQEEYLRKISTFIGKALPLLSNENSSIFTDSVKMNTLHLHKVTGKEKLLHEIFAAYDFNEKAIANFLEGADIYQLEVPFENGASRVVFQKIDNLISFLFMDPNHHIYLNKKIVDGNGSLFFDYCPVNKINKCDRMNYLNTCFAFDFLDKERYYETYEYTFDTKSI